MNSVPVQCPHCQAQYALRNDSLGAPLRCPACQHEFVAPKPMGVIDSGDALDADGDSSGKTASATAGEVSKYWPHLACVGSGLFSFLLWTFSGSGAFGVLSLFCGVGLAAFGYFHPSRVAFFDRMPSLPAMLFAAISGGGVLGILGVIIRQIGRMSRRDDLDRNIGSSLLIMAVVAGGLLAAMAGLLFLVKRYGPFRPGAVVFSLFAIGFPITWQAGLVLQRMGQRQAAQIRQSQQAKQLAAKQEREKKRRTQKSDRDPAETARLDKQSRKMEEAMESILNAATSANGPIDGLLSSANDPMELQRLAEILRTGSDDQKDEAARSLRYMDPPRGGRMEAEITNQLNSLLAAPSSSFQLSIIKALGVWGNQQSELLLGEILKTGGPTKQQQYALEALAERNTISSAKIVARQLAGANKSHAIRALRRMDNEHIENALIAEISERSIVLEAPVIALLGQVGSTKSLPVLQAASQSEDAGIARAATQAIRRIHGS